MALWAQWSAKLDELSLRERALVFVAVAAVVVLLVHAVALQPLLREQRAYLERVKQNQTQLQSINDALLKGAQGAAHDPRVAKRERIRALEGQVAASERALAERRKEQITPEQLTRLLQDIVGRNGNLRVHALRVLPGTPLSAAPTTGMPPAPPGRGALYRHAVEVEMSGSYLELLSYLEEVEALPWRLGWASVELKTTAYPEVHLKATLSTVSASPMLITF